MPRSKHDEKSPFASHSTRQRAHGFARAQNTPSFIGDAAIFASERTNPAGFARFSRICDDLTGAGQRLDLLDRGPSL